MLIRTVIIVSLLYVCTGIAYAQNIAWDDTQNKNWGRGFEKIEVTSSKDQTLQPCIIHKTTSQKPQPLIVSLHSWSGDFAQADSISYQIIERDWNYIHPHFRGPNWTANACGSALMIADIEDAIRYMIKNTKVNPSEIHIVGSSGGGHATMLAYMKLNYPVKSFSSWVGISNLVDWYYESLGRRQRYTKDILKATGDTNKLNEQEAKKRSAYFQPLPKNRQNAKLYLYAGIHDGYQGSVPITQTILFYNRLIGEMYPKSTNLLVSENDMLELVVKRNFLKNQPHPTAKLGDRTVHYQKQKDNISLTIFEGKHEQVVKSVIDLLPISQ
jgi:dienelactone hydrolase